MYTYKVYDFDYDDTSSFELLHKSKFTKQEYENIVNDCLIKITEKIKRNQKIIEELEDGEISDERAEELELWSFNSELDICSNLYKMLIKEYGFEKMPKPIYTFTLHGGFYGESPIEENRVIE